MQEQKRPASVKQVALGSEIREGEEVGWWWTSSVVIQILSYFFVFALRDQQLMFNSSVAIQLMSTLFNKATVQIFISGKECSRGAADPDATCGRHRSGASGGARCSGLPLVTRGLLEAG